MSSLLAMTTTPASPRFSAAGTTTAPGTASKQQVPLFFAEAKAPVSGPPASWDPSCESRNIGSFAQEQEQDIRFHREEQKTTSFSYSRPVLPSQPKTPLPLHSCRGKSFSAFSHVSTTTETNVHQGSYATSSLRNLTPQSQRRVAEKCTASPDDDPKCCFDTDTGEESAASNTDDILRLGKEQTIMNGSEGQLQSPSSFVSTIVYGDNSLTGNSDSSSPTIKDCLQVVPVAGSFSRTAKATIQTTAGAISDNITQTAVRAAAKAIDQMSTQAVTRTPSLGLDRQQHLFQKDASKGEQSITEKSSLDGHIDDASNDKTCRLPPCYHDPHNGHSNYSNDETYSSGSCQENDRGHSISFVGGRGDDGGGLSESRPPLNIPNYSDDNLCFLAEERSTSTTLFPTTALSQKSLLGARESSFSPSPPPPPSVSAFPSGKEDDYDEKEKNVANEGNGTATQQEYFSQREPSLELETLPQKPLAIQRPSSAAAQQVNCSSDDDSINQQMCGSVLEDMFFANDGIPSLSWWQRDGEIKGDTTFLEKFSQPPPHLCSVREKLLADFEGKKIYLFLDYDGTLTPIVKNPWEAKLSVRMRQVLYDLAADSSNLFTVGIVTGRALASVKNFVKIEASEHMNFIYAASHGFHIEAAGRMLHHRVGTRYIPILKHAAEEVEQALRHIPGVSLEDNEFAVSVHYRNCAEDAEQQVEAIVLRILERYANLKMTRGKKVFELRINVGWDKGRAVYWLLNAMRVNPFEDNEIRIVYLGDDLTDEDAFRAVRRFNTQSLTVLVSEMPASRPTAAAYFVKDPDEVGELLEDFLQLAKRHEKH